MKKNIVYVLGLVLAVALTTMVNQKVAQSQLEAAVKAEKVEGEYWANIVSRTCGESIYWNGTTDFTIVVVNHPEYEEGQAFWDENWHMMGFVNYDPKNYSQYTITLPPDEYLIGFRLGEHIVISHTEGVFEKGFVGYNRCEMQWFRYVVTETTKLVAAMQAFPREPTQP